MLLVIVALGLVFELPVLIFFLSVFGIVTPKFLIQNTKYAVLVITVVAAIVTPTPDAMTMLMVMGVMTGLVFCWGGSFVGGGARGESDAWRRRRGAEHDDAKVFRITTRGKALQCAFCGIGCCWGSQGAKRRRDGEVNEASGATAPFMASCRCAAAQVPDDALPAEKTGGFDGKLAYEHVAKLVGFGPRPSGSQAIAQAQDYITSQLSSFGCTVDTDSFSSDTPAGRLPMKNIVVKIPGERQGIILLATHYDTKKLDNFVGADDGGSSTGSDAGTGTTNVRTAAALLDLDRVFRRGRSGAEAVAGSRQPLRQPADGGEDGGQRRPEKSPRDDSGRSGGRQDAGYPARKRTPPRS